MVYCLVTVTLFIMNFNAFSQHQYSTLNSEKINQSILMYDGRLISPHEIEKMDKATNDSFTHNLNRVFISIIRPADQSNALRLYFECGDSSQNTTVYFLASKSWMKKISINRLIKTLKKSDSVLILTDEKTATNNKALLTNMGGKTNHIIWLSKKFSLKRLNSNHEDILYLIVIQNK